ncbi:uncharacterized protein ColSpa_04157 [Colletotrichum spaethianum]|uniref:Stress activated map kinase interacting n=1 Tax=Colletotrichum spaethianum TaxID=700344 RepID=A0AA37L8G8_9PEZI|nr:uncharacterized protein ColSpa_04157 [Colletotrichum spaethianum]GKT43976.1 hypothetical protein ColSpa_04157 [Colletotrichum spaethianum]
MGLVDYSESSGSEDEAPVKPNTTKPAPTTGKKPFQKVVDRSNPGKIVVSLPSSQSEDPKPASDEPPAKRARTGKSGLFSGFNSFLPAPKNAAKAAPAQSSSSNSSSSARPVFQLKTGAEPGFSRERGGGDGEGSSGTGGGGMSLPAPKAQAQPTIPEGMKPADEVKLVGKPMMFKPLSVARKPKKKTPASTPATAPKPTSTGDRGSEAKDAPPAAPAPAPAAKKVSLFSIEADDAPSDSAPASGAYEPLFETEQPTDNGYADYAAQAGWSAPTTAPDPANSLDTIADDLNLSAAARRELFGRQKGGGAPQTASRVINFNTDQEYKHNEELRASGQQQIHNPVRAIAPGKHNLRQLVNQVQNQREALEDSFAKGKSNRKEASSRYGW